MNTKEVMSGKEVYYKNTLVNITAVSKRSGSVTVEFKEDYKPYNKGDKIVVMPYDLTKSKSPITW